MNYSEVMEQFLQPLNHSAVSFPQIHIVYPLLETLHIHLGVKNKKIPKGHYIEIKWRSSVKINVSDNLSEHSFFFFLLVLLILFDNY